MISLSMVMQFLGGLGLFLYGINTTADGLQKLAANRLKAILESLTKKTWSATLFGMAMTVALQSSAATTVMVVEFVNSGLMTLVQALGVALGSAVGTSLVIQLISFPIQDIALLLLFIGFILFLIIKTPSAKTIGRIFIGFGCIFVGMSYLSGAFAPLKNAPEVHDFLSRFGQQPVLGILLSTALTTLIQSSAAFLAILISLSSQGLLTIDTIVPLVIGAHIGGTVTTLISSLGAERADAKRVAVANSIYRIFAAVLLLPFFTQFAVLIQWSAADLPRQVANTHLFSAVFMVVVFLPLNGILAKFLIKFIPQRKAKIEEHKPIYLTRAAVEVPTVALSQAGQEIRWLGYRILDGMLQIIPRIISSGELRFFTEVQRTKEQADWHYTQIAEFLQALSRRSMTRKQIVDSHDMQLVAKQQEYIAYSLEAMARVGQRIHSEKIIINQNELGYLEELYVNVSANYLAFLRSLDRWDTDIALDTIDNHKDIIRAYNVLQSRIISRTGECLADDSLPPDENLTKGQEVLIDLANWLYLVAEHIVTAARVIQNWEKKNDS